MSMESVETDRHCFQFGVVIEADRSEFAAYAAHFESAERSTCVEDVVTVYPDGARLDGICVLMSLADVASPYGCGQTIER